MKKLTLIGRRLFLNVLVLYLLSGVIASVHAQQYTRFTDYAYISGTEITLDGDTLGWTGSAFYGPFHFNSVFKADAAIFTDPVFCAQPRFNVGGQYLGGLTFNADSIAFSDSLHALRELADWSGLFYSNHRGSWQTRIKLVGTRAYLEQWEMGAPYDSCSLVNHESIWCGSGTSIFVEGELQVLSPRRNSPSINGQVSIGCSGNMTLMNDIIIDPYTNENFPFVIPDITYSRLALLSEQNILIGNTSANGRGNGFHEGNGSHDRAHVVITAALVTLGQLTIENQNNPDDAYIWCDPNGAHPDQTDERGTIFLRGSLAQQQRGQLHNSNCGGTGYNLDFYYDERLAVYPPNGIPSISPEEDQIVIWNREGTTWQDTTVYVTQPILVFMSLTLGPGTTIHADLGGKPLFQFRYGDLRVEGEADNPVSIHFTDAGEYQSSLVYNTSEGLPMRELQSYFGNHEWSGLHIYGNRLLVNMPEMLTDARFEANHIELRGLCEEYDSCPYSISNSTLIADTIVCTANEDYSDDREWSGLHIYGNRLTLNIPDRLTKSEFVANHIELRGLSSSHSINRSTLIADTILCSTEQNEYDNFTSNLVIGSLFNKFSTIDRCTFIDPGNARCAITNDLNRDVVIRSCFFQGYEAALVRGSGGQLDYCAYDQFPNGYPFWNPMEVGENILANVDPMFVEPDSMNYYLLPGSPLIDAGSPDSPRDPDRSIADIGAYWCDPTDVPDDLTSTESLPTAFRIESVYPNPFNPVAEVTLALPRSGVVRVELVDILGRSVAAIHDGLMLAGMQTMTINGASLASGTYFLRASGQQGMDVRKILLLK